MRAVEHLETERTFDVEDTLALPGLAGGPVASVGTPVTRQLESTYHDTEDLALASARTTLRLRSGGDDDGWHLKLPVAQDQRLEVRLPVGRSRTTPPARLRRQVQVRVRGRRLHPVVRLTTRRVELPLLDADGAVLGVVCDDHVQAERLGDQVRTTAWREWEVELVDGGPDVLAGVSSRLVEAGARPSLHASKLARALGGDLPPRQLAPTRSPRMSVGDLLLDRVGVHVADLVSADPRVRDDEDDAVHAMRVSTRRLRSLLGTFRPVLVREVTEPLRAELRWLAGVLGQARDAEVLRGRLGGLVGAEPPELVLGPVARRIDDELGARYREAHARAVAVLDDPRYFALLESLDALLSDPPLRPEAAQRARDVVPGLLHRDWRRLRRASEAAREGSGEKEEALHELRKLAKRLRYGADAGIPVFGRRAKALSAMAEGVQEALGEHQDAVGARDYLRQVGVQAHLAGENGFTFGRLHALEQQRADAAARRFRRSWAKVDSPRLRRWSSR